MGLGCKHPRPQNALKPEDDTMDTIELKTDWGPLQVPSYSTGMIDKIRRTGGFELHKLRRFMAWSRFFYGKTEEDPGVFWDIGANVGTTSIPVIQSPLVSRVVALEPVPELYRILVENIRANELEDLVEPMNLAAGSCPGEVEIHLNPEFCGDNRLGESPGEEWETRFTEVITLGSGFLGKPSFIWMDVQGWETHVLEGAGDLLEREDLPWFLEFWPRGLQDPETFFQILETHWTRLIDAKTQDVQPITNARKIFQVLYDRSETAHTDLFLIK